MRRVEITRTGDASIAEQLAEMRDWLRDEGIEPIELEPLHILGALVRFRASFAAPEEADRFCAAFDEAGALATG